MLFDTHLNLYDTCYESAFIQKTTVSSSISTDISLFLPLIVEVTLPDLMIYLLSNLVDTVRWTKKTRLFQISNDNMRF